MTFFDQHTVAELRDLLASKDFEIKEVQTRYDANADAWRARDPEGENEWRRDWRDFLDRYNDAHAKAKVAIAAGDALITVRNSMIPAEGPYNDVIRTMKKNPDPGTPYEPTDFQGMYNRLIEATGSGHIDFSKMPQPDPKSDFDMRRLKDADDALKGVQKAADTAGGLGKNAIRDVVKANPLLAIGGGVLGLGFLYAVLRR
jgi:hypothetical protein